MNPYLSMLGGMGGMGGQNPMQQYNGQDAQQNGQQAMAGVQQQLEYGTEGMPPSLAQQLGQQQSQEQQMAAQTPQPEFGQYYQSGFQPGVLPSIDPNSGQMNANTQVFPVGSGAQMPMAQGFAPLTPLTPMGGAQQQPSDPSGQGSLLNLIGTIQHPNLLLRLAEGYNRGGLMGALGLGLTRM